jgi:inward rectifier potassium channel
MPEGDQLAGDEAAECAAEESAATAGDAAEPPIPVLGMTAGVEGGVVFIGRGKDGWRDTYHQLLVMPLWAFFGAGALWYVAVNAAFAVAYMLTGGVTGMPRGDFFQAFFFSVETLSTVGYGEMAPAGFAAHSVVVVESFVGLFNLAIATGLLFARFSRPTARVIFSERAVVAEHDGRPTLMLRAANRRRNRIVEAEVSLTLVRDRTTLEGDVLRSFETLPTIRARSPLFSLTWQIMHRIDEESPLYGENNESLVARRGEILVVLRGLDETFSQTVHARTSYPPDKIAWNTQFVPIFSRDGRGRFTIDYTHFDDIV